MIDLSWKNPPDPDFDLVRIVRSETFFPSNPFEGIVVYEGRGTATTDTNVREGVTYYYSIFARDKAGNFSEGSIARAKLIVGIPPEPSPPPLEDFPPAPFVPPLIQEFDLFHIDFIQDGKKIPYIGLDQVPIDGRKDLTVSVDYERLPEILKTLAITVVDPEDPTKTFSFLLRVTPDKTAYRTTLAPFERGGVYAFDVHILDHQNQGLKKLDGQMLVAAAIEGVEVIDIKEKLQKILTVSFCFLLLVLLLLTLILAGIISFVRNKDTRVRKGILIFILILALITVLVLRKTIADEYFCFAFFILLLLLIARGIYAFLKKRFFAYEKDKNSNINHKDDTNTNITSFRP